MAPKPKSIPKPPGSRPHLFKNRMALGAYIADPESYPPSVVIYHNADFVVIHDKFPKATVHTLLLPRSPRHSLLHPFEALRDEEFLAKVRIEVEKLKVLAAGELQRRLGMFSRADAAREAVLNGETEVLDDDDDDDDGGQRKGKTATTEDGGEEDKDKSNGRRNEPKLPSGRDWAAEIKCGVHAVPSMGHLHIHVFSRDMHSPAMKHRKHYNSFNTPFLVDVADFPLESDDLRRSSREEGFMKRDLVCWRCGENFGNRFKELKEHLEKEFEEWKRE